jgi:phosphatidate cytidylyltransferase
MLVQRVITAAILAALVIPAILLLDAPYVIALFGAMIVLGAWEWAGFAKVSAVVRVGYVMVIAVPMVIRLFVDGSLWAEYLIITGLIWWCSWVLWLPLFPMRTRALFANRGLVLIAGALALWPFWLMMAEFIYAGGARGDILAGFMMVWAADSGAYFVGRAFGQHKLAPAVSPGKTWEGAVGGLVLGMAVILVYLLWIKGVGLGWWMLGIVLALTFYITGDLAISAYKRSAGLKDSGKIFPGHGGVLDRVDGLIAVIPIYLWVMLVSL